MLKVAEYQFFMKYGKFDIVHLRTITCSLVKQMEHFHYEWLRF